MDGLNQSNHQPTQLRNVYGQPLLFDPFAESFKFMVEDVKTRKKVDSDTLAAGGAMFGITMALNALNIFVTSYVEQ